MSLGIRGGGLEAEGWDEEEERSENDEGGYEGEDSP